MVMKALYQAGLPQVLCPFGIRGTLTEGLAVITDSGEGGTVGEKGPGDHGARGSRGPLLEYRTEGLSEKVSING